MSQVSTAPEHGISDKRPHADPLPSITPAYPPGGAWRHNCHCGAAFIASGHHDAERDETEYRIKLVSDPHTIVRRHHVTGPHAYTEPDWIAALDGLHHHVTAQPEEIPTVTDQATVRTIDAEPASNQATEPAGALTVTTTQTFWTREQRAALAQMGIDDASNADLVIFLQRCQQTQLDPWAGQIWMVGRWDSRKGRKVWTIQTGIAGFLLCAERSDRYQGMTKVEWCGKDGVWVDVWLADEPPAAARVGVHKAGFVEPQVAVAIFKEYAPRNKKGELTGLWPEKPAHMIAKVAKTIALREAFPQDMSGIYAPEEMDQRDVRADVVEQVTVSSAPPVGAPVADEPAASASETVTNTAEQECASREQWKAAIAAAETAAPEETRGRLQWLRQEAAHRIPGERAIGLAIGSALSRVERKLNREPSPSENVSP